MLRLARDIGTLIIFLGDSVLVPFVLRCCGMLSLMSPSDKNVVFSEPSHSHFEVVNIPCTNFFFLKKTTRNCAYKLLLTISGKNWYFWFFLSYMSFWTENTLEFKKVFATVPAILELFLSPSKFCLPRTDIFLSHASRFRRCMGLCACVFRFI